MYERHFGITGPPFQLSPDPSFYFDGSQHRAALAMLRQAFSRDLPFVVLSGEIGAGKTTVLHAWLAECRSEGIAVAQISNTQLDAAELQCAIAAAFGVDASLVQAGGASGALRRFLRELNGSPAALSIDEAQNLDREALQCLVQLALVAAEEHARLRIVLAGQPELRAHVSAGALPELDALVQQACHLGTLDAGQTRQYIEHRLLKVGWNGRALVRRCRLRRDPRIDRGHPPPHQRAGQPAAAGPVSEPHGPHRPPGGERDRPGAGRRNRRRNRRAWNHPGTQAAKRPSALREAACWCWPADAATTSRRSP